MDATELAAIDAAFTELFDVLAGDEITAVDTTGARQEFHTFRWQPDSDTSPFEGLSIGSAGMLDQQEANVLLLKSQIVAASWDLDATDHFEIDGVRWDFSKDKPIRRNLAPLAGWQGIIMITIRKAVELASSTPGSEFTIAP